MKMYFEPLVSVIIPTFREWHLLKRCLSALASQSYPAGKLEIVVVNNDPGDYPPENMNFAENVKIICEPRPGSYAARNTGIRHSSGEIIAFTDSDCLPDSNWIQYGVEYLISHPDCSRVAGNISILYKSSKPTIVEMYNQIYAFPQEWLVANGGGNITGNLFTYRRVFEIVGGFDEQLLSMGDLAWGKKAQSMGFRVKYAEHVLVLHPSRDFQALVKKEKRHGGGAARMAPQIKYTKGVLNLLYQFRPRASAIRLMLGRRKDMGLAHRLIIPLLRYYLLNVRAVEKFRVQMGKAPNRA